MLRAIDADAIRRAALITLRRAIRERFRSGRGAWLAWARLKGAEPAGSACATLALRFELCGVSATAGADSSALLSASALQRTAGRLTSNTRTVAGVLVSLLFRPSRGLDFPCSHG